MQVMNGGDFDQKNVLVGQSGKTESFGVTNDPILMGILSTGLYANPMRTMIQEVMFNAWDAHRMGKCLDKPIDIYINDTSGLIFRDYGPGIAPEMMVPTYCIYGNSTKRNDDEATGGFGLGSKSPYAYTDSFTVTTHHNSSKSMYIMNRVSEENNGAPGMSPIIQNVPTDQSGLLVTIPLKSDSDMDRAYRYIQELLPMSGIKAKIHFNDNEELIETETIAPGEWVVSDQEAGHLWAVYGGVRYKIPHDDKYVETYDFCKKMAALLGSFHIGFKPSSLTPLPSREGLNMNERTVENIRNQLEIIEESMRQVLLPAARVVLKESFKSMMESGIEPKFLVQMWAKVGERRNLSQMTDTNHPILEASYNQKLDSVPQSMWNSLCVLIFKATDKAEKFIGFEKMSQMKYIIWAKNFPHLTEYKSFLLQKYNASGIYKSIQQIEAPKTCAEMIEAKKIADAATDRNNDLRVLGGDTWLPVTNIRRAGKVTNQNLTYLQEQKIKALGKDKIKIPNKEYPDRLWVVKTGAEFNEIYATKTILIAKTLSALKDTRWAWQPVFTVKYGTITNYHNFHRSHYGQHHYQGLQELAGALIVHQANGAYDEAVKALKAAGYDVLEADEPEVKTRPVKVLKDGQIIEKPKVPTYPLLDTGIGNWASWDEVENPTCFVCVTEHKIRHGYSSDKPNAYLLNYVKRNTPRMVIIHSKARESRLIEKLKAKSFSDKLHELVKKILSNEDRVKQMYLYHVFMENSTLPESLRNIPEVQKFFKVPYIRSAQLTNFIDDYKVLQTISDSGRSYHYHLSTKVAVDQKFRELAKDPSVVLVREISQKCSFLDRYQLNSYLSGKKPGEVKVFSEKLLKFLRTV